MGTRLVNLGVKMLALISASFLFGAGCVSRPETTLRLPSLEVKPASPVFERGTVAPGIQVVRSSSTTTEEGTLFLFGFDEARYRFRFVATSTRVTMREWMRVFPEAQAAVNGVYFHEDLSPSGWFVSAEFQQRARTFDLAQAALILTERGRVRLLDTGKERVALKEVKSGAQTYPILISQGQSRLTRDTGKVARRSWMGVDRDGKVWVGVLVDGQMSLYGLMRRLQTLPIAWEMVVNLDGGPSTGMFVRGDEGEFVRETLGGVPNVLLVERRS